jgi:hypothetical protein
MGPQPRKVGHTMALSARRYYKEHLFIAATIDAEQKLIDKDREPGGNSWHAYNRGKGVSRLRSQRWAQEANRHECRVVMDGQPVCSCGLIATKPLLEDDAFEVALYLYEPGHIDKDLKPVTFFVVETNFETDGGEQWLFCQFCALIDKVIDGTEVETAIQFEFLKAQHTACSKTEYFQRLGLDEAKFEAANTGAAAALQHQIEKNLKRKVQTSKKPVAE